MPEHEGAEVRATEAAQRKAEELGVDPSQVTGTGADGKVTPRDVERHAALAVQEGEESASSNVRLLTLHEDFGVGERVVYSGDGEDRTRTVILSGTPTPVGQEVYDALPKDEEGNVQYPLVEIDTNETKEEG